MRQRDDLEACHKALRDQHRVVWVCYFRVIARATAPLLARLLALEPLAIALTVVLFTATASFAANEPDEMPDGAAPAPPQVAERFKKWHLLTEDMPGVLDEFTVVRPCLRIQDIEPRMAIDTAHSNAVIDTLRSPVTIRVLSLDGHSRSFAVGKIVGGCRYEASPSVKPGGLAAEYHGPRGSQGKLTRAEALGWSTVVLAEGSLAQRKVVLHRVPEQVSYYQEGAYQGWREPENRVADPQPTRAELRALFARADLQAAFQPAPLTCTADGASIQVQAFRARYQKSLPPQSLLSINWGCGDDRVPLSGEFWGIFRPVGDQFVPIYLAPRRVARTIFGNSYEIIGVGDLDGDGIDELIVDKHLYEGHAYGVLTWHEGKLVVAFENPYDGQ